MSNNMGVVCEFELYYFEFWKSAKEYTHLHFSAPIYYHKYASDKNAYKTTIALQQIGSILDSLVVRISACHVEGPGSIPGRGVHFWLFKHAMILQNTQKVDRQRFSVYKQR